LGYGDLAGHASSANTPLARAFAPGPRYGGRTTQIASDLVKLRAAGASAILVTRQAARLPELLAENDIPAHVQHDSPSAAPQPVTVLQGVMSEGFILRGLNGRDTPAADGTPAGAGAGTLHLLTDGELFGWSKPQARSQSKTHSRVAPELFFADVKVGDFVV